MSYEQPKTNFHCIVGRHHSSTISIASDVTKRGQKLTMSKLVQCKRKKQPLLEITQ